MTIRTSTGSGTDTVSNRKESKSDNITVENCQDSVNSLLQSIKNHFYELNCNSNTYISFKGSRT
jgi:hypothetical protein